MFVNPPYGRVSAWWHDHAMQADEIRFIRGRLSFEGVDAPKGHNAPFPSVLLVFRGGDGQQQGTQVAVSVDRERAA